MCINSRPTRSPHRAEHRVILTPLVLPGTLALPAADPVPTPAAGSGGAGVPQPHMITPPGEAVAHVTTILSWGLWAVAAVCVGALLVVGGKMMLSHGRGEGGQHGAGLAWVMAGLLLAGSASALVGALI